MISKFPRGVLFAPDDLVLDGLQRLYGRVNAQTLAIAMGSVVWVEARLTGQQIDMSYVAHPVAIEAIGYAAAMRQVGHRNYGQVIETALTRSRERLDADLDDFAAASTVALDSANQTFSDKVAEVEKDIAALKATGLEAVSTITATNNLFAELMRLKAPKDYWSDKAKEHRDKIKLYRTWLAITTGVSAAVLLLTYAAGYFAMQAFTTQHPAQAIAMTIYVAGFVGSITAIGLWFIRIVVRLYMSQHHLATDAEERASFIHTYLALNEGVRLARRIERLC